MGRTFVAMPMIDPTGSRSSEAAASTLPDRRAKRLEEHDAARNIAAAPNHRSARRRPEPEQRALQVIPMRRRGLGPPPTKCGPGPQPGNPGVISVLCVRIVQNVRFLDGMDAMDVPASVLDDWMLQSDDLDDRPKRLVEGDGLLLGAKPPRPLPALLAPAHAPPVLCSNRSRQSRHASSGPQGATHLWPRCQEAVSREGGPSPEKKSPSTTKALRMQGFRRCAEEDSNLHPLSVDQALNLARLPIPPSARGGTRV